MRVAALTHGHPNGFVSAGAMAAIVRMICAGMPLEDATVASIELVSETGAHETRDILHDALLMASGGLCDPDTMRQRLGEGWVGHEALAIGLYAALVADSFEQAVLIGANHDGDSDSTASLAGQLFGAAHPERPAPNAWVRRLDLLEPACRLVHEWID
jgi:ADP-ribosyl-[dinitrogen reductase] hydrolase